MQLKVNNHHTTCKLKTPQATHHIFYWLKISVCAHIFLTLSINYYVLHAEITLTSTWIYKTSLKLLLNSVLFNYSVRDTISRINTPYKPTPSNPNQTSRTKCQPQKCAPAPEGKSACKSLEGQQLSSCFWRHSSQSRAPGVYKHTGSHSPFA